MSYLTITVRFLGDRYHGRTENGRKPEWPPSPLRLFQAIVAAVAPRWHDIKVQQREQAAMEWFETLDAPTIVAPLQHQARPLLNYVRENLSDEAPDKRDAKFARATIFLSDPAISYCWEIRPEDRDLGNIVAECSRHCHALGWGIDMVIGSGRVTESRPTLETGEKWLPNQASALSVQLRMPVGKCSTSSAGTLQNLLDRYQRSLQRIAPDGRNHVPPVSAYRGVNYRSESDWQPQSIACFELRRLDNHDAWYSVPWACGMKVAAWMRHATANALLQEGHERSFVDGYVLGHGTNGHRQHMSFVPVPSIGTVHADGSIRRVMILEPQDRKDAVSDLQIAEMIQTKLSPSVLRGLVESNGQGRKAEPVCFVTESRDRGVWDYYLPPEKKTVWHSVTPVVLHGFNSLRGKFSLKKTEELLYQAFEGSGYPRSLIAQLCFQPAPFWAGTQGALSMRVPEHLSKWPRYHVAVQFSEPINGPVLAGIGKHYGVGLFAAPPQS